MKREKLLYIISPSFSGSTLLTLLLARHDGIATIGELKATNRGDIEKYYCSCGDRLLDCSFWRDIRQTAQAQGVEFELEDFATHFRSDSRWIDKILGAQVRGTAFEAIRRALIRIAPKLRIQFKNILQQNQSLISLILQHQGTEILVDGSKDPNRLLYFIESGIWDISVINITRDGKAQSNSQRSRPHYKGNYRDAAIEWNKTMLQIQQVLNKVPSTKLHTLKYEDLCRDTAMTMDKVWKFIGLPPIPCDANNLDLKTKEQHILGNKMRTQSHITIRLDERWRNQITPAEHQEFENIGGKTNRQLGYQ